MEMEVERIMLALHRDALHRIAEAAGRVSYSSIFANEVKEIVSGLDSSCEAILEQQVEECLKGRGPVASLKVKLGMTNNYGKNLLAKIPEADRANRSDLMDLVREFLHVKQTNLKRGGLYEIVYENNDYLPTDPDDLRAGIYKVRLTHGDKPCLTIQVVDKETVSYIFILLSGRAYDPVELSIKTFLESEQEWIDHENFGIFSKNTLRGSMVSVIKKLGIELVMPIAFSKVQRLIEEKLQPTLKDTHQHLYIEFQGYRLSVDWIDKSEDAPYYLITVRDLFDHNGITGAQTLKTVPWDKLTTAKQLQLFKELEKKIDKLTT